MACKKILLYGGRNKNPTYNGVPWISRLGLQ